MRYWVFICYFLFSTFQSIGQESEIYNSKSLIIKQLTKSTFVHISYLQTESFGNVACNGMIVVNKNQAFIFDTPTTNEVSEELINFLKSKKISIIGVVATHFHDDCLGGLSAFHKNNIPSYATNKTISFSKEFNVEIPQNGFETNLKLKIKNKHIICYFLGEGHTRDNCIAYFPSEKALFGGCLIKETDATKGYLGDANLNEWSNTVSKIKNKLPEIQTVIPGHGKTGGKELLDYTIQLFKPTNE